MLLGLGALALGGWEVYRLIQANAAAAGSGDGTMPAPQSPTYTVPPYSYVPSPYPTTPPYDPAPAPAPGNSTSPLGIRYNNPGNLQPNGIEKRYPTMQAGIAAAMNNVLTYSSRYHLNTVAGIINRWAPPSKNDTQAYIQYVAHHLGVQPNETISVRSPLTMYDLLMAIFAFENGGQTPSAGLVNSVITSKLGSTIA